MSNYTIEISDDFLERFAEGDRAKAAEKARSLLTSIMLQEDIYKTIVRVYGPDYANPDPSAINRDDELLHSLLDLDARITITDEEGKHHHLPALTALAMHTDIDQKFIKACTPMIAEYAAVDNGNASFENSASCAAACGNMTVMGALSHNLNVNPNQPLTLAPHLKHKCTNIYSKDGALVPSTGRKILPGLTVASSVCQEMLVRSMIDDKESIPELLEIAKNFADHGARVKDVAVFVTHFDEKHIETFAPLRTHYETIIERVQGMLDEQSVTDCTLAQLRDAYALDTLGPIFSYATQNDEARDHLISLREEMPEWMRQELADAYKILGVPTWVGRDDTTEPHRHQNEGRA